MEGFTNFITRLSGTVQKSDPDAIWCFCEGAEKSKEHFNMGEDIFICLKVSSGVSFHCCRQQDNEIILEKCSFIPRKQQNNEILHHRSSETELEIAGDWIRKRQEVIREMVTSTYFKGKSEVLLEWSFLPAKKICKAVAMLLPNLMREDGFKLHINTELIENGDGLLISW